MYCTRARTIRKTFLIKKFIYCCFIYYSFYICIVLMKQGHLILTLTIMDTLAPFYIFLAPYNGIVCYTTFTADKVLIDTYLDNGLWDNKYKELSERGLKLITDENEAVALGLDIYED